MKTGFQIVSLSCTYVSSMMRAVFDDILVPWYPWILCKDPPPPSVRAQHDPEKNNFVIFYF